MAAARHDVARVTQRSLPRRPLPVCTSSLSVEVRPLATTVHFRERGSGLLWASSTGTKLWDGARLLSHVMLDQSVPVGEALAAAAAAATQQQGEATATEPGATSSSGGCGSDNVSRSGATAVTTPWSWRGKRVIELGCGLALCSVVAALLGAHALATDGEPGIVSVAKKNIAGNLRAASAAAAPSGEALGSATAALLPWGDPDTNLPRCGIAQQQQQQQQQQQHRPTSFSPCSFAAPFDVVLMSDVVYGSDPGLWAKLLDTLCALCGPGTVVLQAESARLEGRGYPQYWSMLEERGFSRRLLAESAEVAAGGRVMESRVTMSGVSSTSKSVATAVTIGDGPLGGLCKVWLITKSVSHPQHHNY